MGENWVITTQYEHGHMTMNRPDKLKSEDRNTKTLESQKYRKLVDLSSTASNRESPYHLTENNK